MRAASCIAVAFAGLCLAAPARAGDVTDTDRQIAQSLFDEARSLLESGHVAEACPKFAESQRLDPGGGTLLNLALCLELAGQTASAWARYQEAAALAVRDGRKDREEFARTHLATIKPLLTRLIVVVPASAAATEPIVQLDGSRLTREAWGTAIPVDPGAHRVSASASSGGSAHDAWETTVDAREPARTYRIEVGMPRATTLESAPPPQEPATERRRSTAFWIMLGTGGAAVAASAVVGVMALGANSDAQAGCVPERSFCSESARDARSRARTLAWISTGLTAGGIALGAAAFLLPLETRAVVEPTASGTGMRVSITRFF